MDLGIRCRSARPSKRYDLLEGPWQDRRFELHRQRVRQAEAKVDNAQPVSATFQHLQHNKKKHQKEYEQQYEVMTSNLILLRHLSEIASTKRVDDGMTPKKIHWQDHFNAILLVRRQQVQRLVKQLEDDDRKKSSKDSQKRQQQ